MFPPYVCTNVSHGVDSLAIDYYYCYYYYYVEVNVFKRRSDLNAPFCTCIQSKVSY